VPDGDSRQPLTEAGLRRLFRTHRLVSGALRMRLHWLRCTYRTELNSGISLQALMALHVFTEMTLRYAAPAVRTGAAY
jgi:integrase/recombinase XerC